MRACGLVGTVSGGQVTSDPCYKVDGGRGTTGRCQQHLFAKFSDGGSSFGGSYSELLR